MTNDVQGSGSTAQIVPRGSNAGVRPPEAALFSIPPADREEFDALPDDVREDIVSLLGIFRAASRAPSLVRMFRASARPGRSGRSVKTLQRKWCEYMNAAGDWRVLVNGAKVPSERSLPKEFVDFIQGWFTRNKRVARQQYHKLCRFWQQGVDDKGKPFLVPGYGTAADWSRGEMEKGGKGESSSAPRPLGSSADLPPGWSYANLMRARYRLSKAQEKMAREGTTAARSLTPYILGTRKGLRFLEVVTFDDVKCDFRVIDPKGGALCDLWLLVAFDLATAVCLGYGMRPARVREDGTQEHLKLIDMKQLAGWVLERWGLPPYPITWKLENGCATFPEATAIALRDLSNGAINVSYARMLNGTSTAGYKERALGNSRGKASHEAHNNLLHNMAGDLPGQTGRRWDVRPADLASREKEARDIFALAQSLSPERAKGMRYPVLTLLQAREELNRIFDQMNGRTVHELEGFEEVIEWRRTAFEPWQTISELPGDVQGYEVRTRMESPYERMRRLVAPFVGRPDSGWRGVARSTLVHFYQETQRPVEVNERGEITFTHEKRELVFMSGNGQWAMGKGLESSALAPIASCPTPGTKFLAYFHPGEPDFLHLTRLEPHKGYVATWVRRERVRHGDATALQAALSYTEGALKAQREHLARVTAGERADLDDMRASNARLIDEQAADMNAVAPVAGRAALGKPDSGPRSQAGEDQGGAATPPYQGNDSGIAAALDAARGAIQRGRFNEAAREREEQALADLAASALTKGTEE